MVILYLGKTGVDLQPSRVRGWHGVFFTCAGPGVPQSVQLFLEKVFDSSFLFLF